MSGMGDPTTLRPPRRMPPSRQSAGQTPWLDSRRSSATTPTDSRRCADLEPPDRLTWMLPRALLGLVLTASMVLISAAVSGDPFEMFALGATGLLITVLLIGVWAALDAWKRGQQ